MVHQSDLIRYYVTQAGGGGLNEFYVGSNYQKGMGVGSFLGGLFRNILPFLRSGAAAVGREAARAGSHVLADLASGENVRSSISKHVSEAGDNLAARLKRKATSMQGSGIKKRRTVRKAQLRTITRRNKKSPRDIFA